MAAVMILCKGCGTIIPCINVTHYCPGPERVVVGVKP
jgi:hypothetical protein